MITITRWAGRHPFLVRFVFLPILFYIQGRLAFIAGATLFFDGITLSESWVWAMIATLWIAAFIYPQEAKAMLKTAYWRIKGLEWVACTAAFGLWVYAGNQMARQHENTYVGKQSGLVKTAGYYSERVEPQTERATNEKLSEKQSKRTVIAEKGLTHSIKKAYRNYFKTAIKAIKQKHAQKGLPMAVGIILGVLGIGLGIVVLVCGIQCGSTGGGIALGVIGGLALIGLGIWALIAGLRKTNVG